MRVGPARRSAVAALMVGSLTLGLGGGTLPEPPTTIAAALGVGEGDPSLLDARRALAVAERTTHCLAAQGVMYVATPEPPPAVPDASLAPLAWAERWGFGVSTWVAGPPDVGAVPGPRPGSPPGLSACATASATDVYGTRDRALAGLRPALAVLADRVDADPRTVGARRGWRRCVLGLTEAPPLGGRGRAVYPGFVIGWFAARAAETSGDPDALAVVQGQERVVAVGLVRCELAFEAVRSAVRGGYERAFVRRFERTLRGIGARIRALESGYPSLPEADVGP